jgi:hypothetical protein
MMTARDLVEIEQLIERWERGEGVWSDPPLCTLLVGEIARLRTLLRDVFPFVVGTPMQEEVLAEMSEDPRRAAGSRSARRLALPVTAGTRVTGRRRRVPRSAVA